MANLFDPTTINGMALQNRLVRSATWEGMCEQDGRPTEKLANWYRDLVQGGIGLIVSGYTFVRPEGKGLPGKMGIHTDDFSGDYENLTRAVHDAGGKIVVQLVHAGGQTDAKNAGRQPLAPSAVQVDQFPEIPAELTKDEIIDIAAAFGEGARRARAWGFDAVQLHGAHGFLINQFLSPLTNRRTDEYGGSIENRSRFLLEVYQEVRETVGADYPVMIKLNAADNLDGGLELDDALYAAKKLAEAGIDAIEVSAGTPASGAENPAREKINKPEKEAYNLELAQRIKDMVNCPVMVVGGFRSYEVAEKALRENGMDYIAMARPLIREPDLANRWLQGDDSAAKCISCNGCFKPGLEEGGIYCVIEKKEREKAAKD
ncbi:MAG: NADH:flavin oxidoreductase [Deltaproteobacteria bacterium]|nr:NADH:flavin oxidoreductase [Deltaproteobacteria bacterium]MBW1969434.1 NADH:flavin oxidoreductase [Deltaproteobacteria bacterium]MBW2156448.1 NADH:flavin oxidoreductase [Deltaproteobacteria bacterium]MBW2326416.1 NADH:flavin oxidoreductase [Deltaproteobacteria bacterium]